MGKWGRSVWLGLWILLGLVGPVWAQGDEGGWVRGSGPVASVRFVAVDPSSPDFLLLFLGNHARRNPDQTQAAQGTSTPTWGLYFSPDAGESWRPASNDLALFQPTFLHIFAQERGSVAWVGTGEHGLWRSENRGRTWRPVLAAEMTHQTMVAMTQDARGRLHVVTTDQNRYPDTHLYTSRDGGQTWFHRQIFSYQADPKTQVVELQADPFDPNRLYLLTQGGLMISQDAGFTWKSIDLPLPQATTPASPPVLALDPTQRGRAYLAERVGRDPGESQILSFLSLDGGLSWEARVSRFQPFPGMHTPLIATPLHLHLDPFKRHHLLLATDVGLWISENGGDSWRLAGSELAGVGVRDVVIHPKQRNHWLAFGSAGVWRTDTGGADWRPSQEGLPPTGHIHDLMAFPDSSVILALNGGPILDEAISQPLWRSSDGGRTWMAAMRGLEGTQPRRFLAYPYDARTAFLLTDKGLARTDNEGLSWLQIPLPQFPLSLAADPASPAVYVGTSQGLWQSEDKGGHWHPVFESGNVVAVTVDAAGVVFLVTYEQDETLTLWRGPQGQNWQQQGPLPVTGAIQLQAHPQQPGLLTLTGPWEGLWVSVDEGRTWERRDRGISTPTRWRAGAAEQAPGPNLLALYMDPITGVWWAGRDGGGVYRSINNGAQWTDVTDDLGDVLFLSFARSKQTLVAGSATAGVFLWQKDHNSASEPPAQVDARIEIFWPHDFAPVTSAQKANLGLRLYQDHSLEPPPCAWSPNIILWAARDAEPLRRLGLADHRDVEGHPFPFWVMNDVDVTWANDPEHQLIYMAQVAPGLAESHSSVWVHAADARTRLPHPPQPQGLAPAGVTAWDGRILVVWPHDTHGQQVPPDQAPLVNITAALFQRDTLLALDEADLPERLWLVGALDNQVGRRLAVGKPRQVTSNGLRYTVYDFNDIDVRAAQDSNHHWAFWLEASHADLTSNVWIHGSDPRTMAPRVLEPITACQP